MIADERTTEPLQALVSLGLLRAAGQGEKVELSFRHALIRDVAYASLTRRERSRLHRLIGEVLEGASDPSAPDLAEALARHFAGAGDVARAVRYGRRAASHAVAVLAYDEARLQLETVEALARKAGETRLLAETLEQRGDVLNLMRLGTQAIAVYQEALEATQTAASDQAVLLRLYAKVMRTAASVRWAVGREAYRAAYQASAASRRSLEAALPAVDRLLPASEQVWLFAVLSLDAWRNVEPPDWEAAMRLARRAVAIAEASGDPRHQSVALEALGDAALGRGDLLAFQAAAEHRLALTQAPTFADRAQRLDALRGAGAALMYLGRYQAALGLLGQAEALALEILAVDQQFNAIALQCQCAFRLDRWDEVLRLKQRWTDLESRLTSERTGPVCFPLALSAIVHARRGERQAAERDRRRSYAIMLGMGPLESWRSNAHY